MKRIAILGGGFAGLATCWYLLHYTQGSVAIDIYDPIPVGEGASGISSGLLHSYAGRFARRSWEADRGMRETHRLLTEATRMMGRSLILSKGILRPAITEEQITHFQITARHYSDVAWWDRSACEKAIPSLQIPPNGGGLFIKEGLTIDVPGYLKGIWQACTLLGTQWILHPVTKDAQLSRYDRVLIAMGASCKYFIPLKDLPFSIVKGQTLELAWPEGTPPLPFSLNSEKYIIMGKNNKTCFVGSTYEHDFTSIEPEIEKAKQGILPQVLSFFPPLKDAPVLGCRAGFRAGTPNRLPLVGKVSEQIYFFTGLGSKGLLYHAWIGKHVARALLSANEKYFPTKLHYKLEPTP